MQRIESIRIRFSWFRVGSIRSIPFLPQLIVNGFNCKFQISTASGDSFFDIWSKEESASSIEETDSSIEDADSSIEETDPNEQKKMQPA